MRSRDYQRMNAIPLPILCEMLKAGIVGQADEMDPRVIGQAVPNGLAGLDGKLTEWGWRVAMGVYASAMDVAIKHGLSTGGPEEQG